jgi:hypothetical protein
MKMAVFWDVSEVLTSSIIRAIILYGVKTFETSVCDYQATRLSRMIFI